MNVKTLCLGILSFGDTTGYDIKKMSVDGPFSNFVDVSYGSIYPALERLTKEGMVLCREEQQSGKPDRKVYSITERGHAALLEALEEEPGPDRFKSEFLFLMICAGWLGRQRIERALDHRLARHDAIIAHLNEAKACCDRKASHFVIGYGLAIHEAARSYLTKNRQAAIDLAEKPDPSSRAAE
ncbi:MAG TPA: PadR family transcriptional regulator [Hyphomicrobiales bacterium]|nr:PadR family transcriptional regulator [Rhodobiaceae bacterium]HXK54557.1 PadR family transcriptional regulator [Hyphomicrobiales bacterium]